VRRKAAKLDGYGGTERMEHLNFETLLRETIGLDAATVGRDTVERAVKLRMRSCGVLKREDYWERLQTSDDERQEFIEAVVVPETWFFRDREAFEALGHLVEKGRLAAQSGAKLHLLSAPCSTGEEPYSIVMAMLNAGFSLGQLKVDALDISIRALTYARRGMFGSNSFRGQDLAYRDRYFEKTPEGSALSPLIRDVVSFHHANLRSPHLHFASHLYDIIFCRNLLIYLDRNTQEHVLGLLGHLLSPSGLLFVGPAEAFLTATCGFTSVNRSLAFAFRKTTSPPQPRQQFRPPHTEKRVKPRAKPVRPSPPAATALGFTPTVPAVPSEVNLAAARSLADAGKLGEALAACEAHLKRRGGTAETYALMGLIHDAKGDRRHAEACYRKALYLEPGNPEALTHLALLAERQGDLQGARRLRARALAPGRTD
jgi:chemotaxis protein methyltransferase WspC